MKSGWFKTRRFNAVLRVQQTPKSKLAKQIRKKIQTNPELAAMKILIRRKVVTSYLGSAILWA